MLLKNNSCAAAIGSSKQKPNLIFLRSILYKTAKYLGDFDSIGKKELESG